MKMIVEGGVPLRGSVTVSGSKNASIKMIAASLLTDEEVILTNVPEIKDVELIKTMASHLGVKVESSAPHKLKLKADNITTTTVPLTLGLPSRSSVIFLGPLLARFGKAAFPQPGGDMIGQRPIDRHLDALVQLGAKMEYVDGVYRGESAKLKGQTIVFRRNTVMGTENAILAATLAEGETVIINAAQEVEIDDLILLLNKMGAKITRNDRSIRIEGVSKLHGAEHEIIPDRNEAVTFAVAGLVTDGDVILEKVHPPHLTAFLAKLDKLGASFTSERGSLRVWKEKAKTFLPINIETSPHPGFMTDWQQPFSLLLCLASGESTIYETIYANRFEYVKELNRMGANIVLLTPDEAKLPLKLDDDSYDIDKLGQPKLIARIKGPTTLSGKKLSISDLRAGATLVLASLMANGRSEISGLEQLDRGYEGFDEKLRSLGAKLSRES